MLSRSPLRSAVTLVLLGSQVSACTSWTTQAVSPEEMFIVGLGVTAGMLAVALDDDPVTCCVPY